MPAITIGHESCRAEIWPLGAAVNGLWVPDRLGAMASVVPGYATADARLAGKAYFGEVVGPVANRIAGAAFTLDGVRYETTPNEAPNTLHGGVLGMHRRVWQVLAQSAESVRLGLDWPDGQEGFPGPFHAEVEYAVTGQTVAHTVTVTTARPTPVNVVSHVYFALSGVMEPVLGQTLRVAASRYLPVDAQLIPLPEAPAAVEGPLDLRAGRLLGDVVRDSHPQIVTAGGLDHAFVLDTPGSRTAVELSDPGSGRRLEITTDYPAVQVYSGQSLAGPNVAHPAGEVAPFTALAIETEDYPGALGREDFPPVILRPGETYRRTTTWAFSVIGN
jgi:aldose 1-epimerase